MTKRRTNLLLLVLAVAAVGAFSAPAFAGGARHGDRGYAQAYLKDCTRFNGRWGYYGNPWCSPREQYLWDRWEARRLARQWR